MRVTRKVNHHPRPVKPVPLGTSQAARVRSDVTVRPTVGLRVANERLREENEALSLRMQEERDQLARTYDSQFAKLERESQRISQVYEGLYQSWAAKQPSLATDPRRIPRFSQHTGGGYDMRQVDDYIDELRMENEKLAGVNQQLFDLYLKEISGLAQTDGRIPEKESPYDEHTISWETIHNLLSHSYTPVQQVSAYTEPQALPSPTPAVLPPAEKPRSRVRNIIGGTVFYMFLAALVLGVYLFGMGDPAAAPRAVGGFAAMTVLTRSMHDVLPQNALIVTRSVDPHTLQIGDDITFLTPQNTTITHRIVDVVPNYRNTGAPGFQTQGTMNPRPDAEIVPAVNVVGQVIFHNLMIGNAVLFIRTNLILVGVMLAIAVAIIIVLRKLVFTPSPKPDAVGAASH